MTAPDTIRTRWDDAPTLPPLHALPRTCEALGVCQHPTRECAGVCEQIPALPAVEVANDEQLDGSDFDGPAIVFWWVCISGVIGVVLGALYGAVRYLWPQVFDALADLAWSINSMLF